MAIWEREYTQKAQVEATAVHSFVKRVYGWMSLGLITTAAVALFIIQSNLFLTLLPFWWIPTFGTLGLAFAIQRGLSRYTFGTLAGLFLVYSGLQGMTFGTILPMIAAAVGGQVIWLAFLTAALIFGLAIAYGTLTKSDLTRFGPILRMGLIGLVAATFLYMILSMFISLTGLDLVISYVGLVLFVALSAFEAQSIRLLSQQVQGNGVIARKLSLMKALQMYINVIMIFWYLLRIFSSSRR